MSKHNKVRSFRTTTIAMIGSTMALCIAIIFIVLHFSTSSILLRTETETLESRLEEARNMLETANLSTTQKAEDVAFWDETVRFAKGKSAAYISRNWSILTPKNNPQLSLMVIKNADGISLASSLFNYADEGPLPLPKGLDKFLRSRGEEAMENARQKLETSADINNLSLSGIAFFEGIPYYLSICPITYPGVDAGIYGTVTSGNMLVNEYFKQITQFDDFNFSLAPAENDAVIGAINIDRTHADVISASLIIADIDGNPVKLSTTAPRTTYQTGRRTQMMTLAILVAVAILCFLAMYLVTTRQLVRPIEKLSGDIRHMNKIGGLNPTKYSDSIEFITLCDSINELVSHLNDSRISIDVFDHILNGMNAYLYVSDPLTGEVLFVNDIMREHFGIAPDAIGKPCWTLLETELTDRCTYCPLPELNEDSTRVVTWEETNKRTGRIYRNTDSLINWAEGRKAHLHHRLDITDLKNIESTLTKRLEQQEIMSELSRGFIAHRDVNSFITNTLKTAGEFIEAGRTLILAVEPETMQVRLAYEWSEEDRGILPIGRTFLPYGPGNPVYDQIILGGKPHLIIEDTTAYPALAHMAAEGVKTQLAMPIIRNGQLWGIMSIAMFSKRTWSQSDIHLFSMITSLIAAVLDQQAVAEVVERMSSIAESSPDYIAYINPEGRFEYLNQGACNVSGFTEDELLTGGISTMLRRDVQADLVDSILPTVRKEGMHEFELPYVHKGGEERLLSVSAFTIDSRPGDVGTIAKDITEQRQMEKDLVEAKEQAERSNHAKSDFLSRMSHEMRTPMNAIIGMTNIAKGSGEIEKKDYCLEKIDEASNHLLGVINDILDMSKIEANKFELSCSEFNFEHMLQKVTNIITFRVDEKSQTLLVNVDDAIPDMVYADEQRLAQIITNLLSNATKFTPDNGTIRLGARLVAQEGKNLTLEFNVTDTGIGISDEQKSRLFRSFEQADGGIARKFGGTGLGLAISKRIIELMGGEIHVESEPGQGSSFIFTVQMTRSDKPVKPARSAGMDMSRLRLLAVDDSPEVLEYFALLSERFGFVCDVASDGYDACRLIDKAEAPYDIAFVDWRMPTMDGIELTRRIKSNPGAPTAVIMISAAEWNDVEATAKEAGVDRFVSKPLYASIIVDCINEIMGSPDYKPEEAEGEQGSATDDYSDKRILLAEDIEINREIVLALLEDTGLHIDTAENGVEAVEKFAQNPDLYDMIFMDIHMPEMDGYEATRRIRAMDIDRAREIPIVAMTANVFREDIERCLAAGMNDHIGKPIDVDEFFTKLRRNLEKGAQHDHS